MRCACIPWKKLIAATEVEVPATLAVGAIVDPVWGDLIDHESRLLHYRATVFKVTGDFIGRFFLMRNRG